MQLGTVNTITNPGLANITNILNWDVNPPDIMNIHLPPCQMQVLKDLHSSYWNELRYSFDGTEQGKDGAGNGEDGVGGQGAHEGSGSAQQVVLDR